MGFRLLWASVGPLVLVGGRGFARHGQPRVLGLVVVAENGSVLVFIIIIIIFLFGFVGMDLAVVDVDGGSGGGSGGRWFWFWI